MFAKVVFSVFGLPIALLCCLLAPLIYVTVIALAPLGLLYRYAVKPMFSGTATPVPQS
jgi:hypothetical protein